MELEVKEEFFIEAARFEENLKLEIVEKEIASPHDVCLECRILNILQCRN